MRAPTAPALPAAILVEGFESRVLPRCAGSTGSKGSEGDSGSAAAVFVIDCLIASQTGEFRNVQSCDHVRRPTTKHRVLVVDDYPDAAETSSMLLTLLGQDCRTAETGARALAEAAEFDPDIVLLDIGLPDISGYEVARELRARPNGQRMYLAAVTGWGAPVDRARAFEAGFDQHVLKPTNKITLEKIIATAARGPDRRALT